MINFKIGIRGFWINIYPSFSEFKITKKRKKDNPLIVRYEADGELIFFGNDYDLLLPYLNGILSLRIVETIGASSHTFSCNLNLDNKKNIYSNQITGDVLIRDDYYNYFDSGDRNIDKDYELNFSGISMKYVNFYSYTNSYFSLFAKDLIRGVLLSDVLSYLINLIDFGTVENNNFFTNEFDNLILYNAKDISTENYIEYKAALISNTMTEELAKHEFYFNLNTFLENFYNLGIFWFLEDGKFQIKKYSDITFTNGTDISAFETDESKNIIYRKDKSSSINITNSNITNRGTLENPFYTKNISFSVIKKLNTEFAFDINIDYQTEKDFEKKDSGYCLINTQHFPIYAINQRMKNGSYFGFVNFTSLSAANEFSDTTTAMSSFGTRSNIFIEGSTINFECNLSLLETNLILYTMKMGQDIALGEFEQSKVLTSGINTQSFLVTESNNYYFLFRKIAPTSQTGTVISSYLVADKYVVSHTMFNGFALNNYALSLDNLIKNQAEQMPEDSGRYDGSTLSFTKRNDKIQNTQYNFDDLLVNIDFSKKVYTETLGWSRLDEVTRTYSQNNKIGFDELVISTN